jgi:plasmid stability protein
VRAVATLHVRGVPDDVYGALAERARERNSSITTETIRLLRRALTLEKPGQAALLEAIRAKRERVAPGTPEISELIREDRDR